MDIMSWLTDEELAQFKNLEESIKKAEDLDEYKKHLAKWIILKEKARIRRG